MRNALSAPQASIGPHEAGAGATPRERALAGPLMSLAAVSLSSDPAHHEQGYPQEYIKTFATAPTFSEMLDEARRGERNNPIDYEPLAVNAKGEWIIDTKRVPTTEGELLLDLANFLDRAEVAVTAEGDEERRTAVQHMRDNVPFLGKEEFNTATAGIADYWIDYLHSDPANKIFVFSPAGHAAQKSTGYVAQHIIESLKSKAEDAIANRVVVIDDDTAQYNLNGVDVGRTRIVMVDDWMGKGTMVKADARQLARVLKNSGRDDLLDTVEVNLLVATKTQVGSILDYLVDPDSQRELKQVAYYRAETEPDSLRPFGAHSPNDLNEGLLKQYAAAMARQSGRPVDLPQAIGIYRPYKRY